MRDMAETRNAVIFRDPPFFGGGFNQHFFNGRTGCAHAKLAGKANGRTAARGLHIKQLRQLIRRPISRWIENGRQALTVEQKAFAHRIIGKQLIGRCLFHAHQIPIGFHFFRQHHRQSGMHALPHFRMRHNDRDAIVLRDAHPSR